MKKLIFLLICMITIAASAQERKVVMGVAPDIYFIHRVGPGESLTSIGNQYAQTAPQLLKYNGFKAGVILHAGDDVKIPITPKNLIQTAKPSGEPVYHIVSRTDNLYRVSQTYYKINLALLREWNGLKQDIVQHGQALIIGYVKGNGKPQVVAKTNTPELKTEEKALDPKPVAQPVARDDAKKNEAPKVAATQPVDEGFFAVPYTQHDTSLSQQYRSGDAAIFKTVSGWSDRKFYVLMNDVAPGTIVRITATNNKSVCAKVLAPLSEPKGGAGLLLRMSNAAASSLAIGDPKFTVTVTYFE